MGLLLSLLFFSLNVHAAADEIEDYGVYVKSSDGYVALDTVPNRSHLQYDFTGSMFDFPVVERSGEGLELVVHYPDFHPAILDVEARPMASAAARHPLEVSVAPMGDDRFRVTADGGIGTDRIVLVNLGCCVDGVYGVALGEPRAAIKEHFAEGAELNPVSAEYVLARVVDAVPDDSVLSELHAYWQKRVAQKEASEHFAFIEKVWSQYEQAEGADARIDKLQHVRSLCNQYLEDHPEGRERDQVKDLLTQAESKLDV
jgi:hypothetical protein